MKEKESPVSKQDAKLGCRGGELRLHFNGRKHNDLMGTQHVLVT